MLADECLIFQECKNKPVIQCHYWKENFFNRTLIWQLVDLKCATGQKKIQEISLTVKLLFLICYENTYFQIGQQFVYKSIDEFTLNLESPSTVVEAALILSYGGGENGCEIPMINLYKKSPHPLIYFN